MLCRRCIQVGPTSYAGGLLYYLLQLLLVVVLKLFEPSVGGVAMPHVLLVALSVAVPER